MDPAPTVSWTSVRTSHGESVSLGLVSAATGQLERRREFHFAALGFLRIEWQGEPPTEIRLLRQWLDTWRGLGHVAEGMAAQSFDMKLERYPTGWWAHFYTSAHAHAVCVGSGWEKTPWGAVQHAAWAALNPSVAEQRSSA